MAFSRLEDADEALLLFHDPHVDLRYFAVALYLH